MSIEISAYQHLGYPSPFTASRQMRSETDGEGKRVLTYTRQLLHV